MASVVDICNLAVARIGESANIVSISPPEETPQANLCATFYPQCRDILLQSHPWSFATRRARLVLLGSETDAWAYTYAMPANCLRMLAVVPDGVTSDYDVDGLAVVRPFALESSSAGVRVVLTDQESAIARYVAAVTDPTLFPPMFVDALSWMLASHLAGPIIKGDAGANMTKHCLGMHEMVKASAISADSAQRHGRPSHNPSWISGR